MLILTLTLTRRLILDAVRVRVRPPSCSRKPLRLAEDILRLASRLATAYG